MSLTEEPGMPKPWPGLQGNPGESREIYRLLAEHSTDMISKHTPEGIYTYVSPACRSLLGYDPEELVGRDPYELFHPEDLEEITRSHSSILEKPDTDTVGYRIRRKDGSFTWFETTSRTIRAPDTGEVLELIAVSRDITERKRVEAELRESAERTEDILESITDEFFAVDHEWRFTYVNERALRRIREEKKSEALTREDILGRNVWELYPELVDSIFYHKYHEAVREQKTVHFEAQSSLTDGWYETHVYPSEEGLSVYYQDITERKRAEEELKESKRRTESILESITDAFVAVDRGWHFAYANERALAILERTREDLLGKNMWEEFPQAPDLPAYREYHRAMASGSSVHFEEFNPWQGIWVEIHAYPSEEGLAIYFRDVTERKRAEEEKDTRTRQQAVLAELGLRALSETDLKSLLDDTTGVVAETLEVDLCKIMEILPDGEGLLVRAGVGWEEGAVGNATEGAGLDSQAGYTLTRSEPVISEDLGAETRFRPSALLREHGAVSGMTVVIPGRGGPFGVLGTHTRSRRTFSDDDLNFLQAVANVLAAAIERTEAEERILFQAHLLEQVQAAVIATDMRGRVRHWNDHAEKLYGWTREEVMGRHITELVVAPGRVEAATEIMEVLKGGGRWEGEFEVRRKDGSRFVAQVTDSLILDAEGHAVGIVGVSTDVTGRKQTEVELRESEERFRAFFETAAVGAAHADPVTGSLLQVNEKLCRFLGYDREELLGMTLSDVTHPDDREHDMDGISRLLRGEVREFATEKRYVRKDGQTVWGQLAVSLVRDQDGRALHTVAITQDVTERKRLEESLREIREAERRRIARDLHDVVLQDLAGALQGMQAAKVESGDFVSELDQEMAALRRAVGSLRNAIYDLRLERDQPFVKAVESLVELNRQLTPEREIGLTVSDDFPPELPGDAEVELLRVLQEALVNARLHSDARRVGVSLSADRRAVLVEVADDGLGFNPAADHKGVGISGMRERASALGARFEIESAPGGGTSVRVEVPYHRDRRPGF